MDSTVVYSLHSTARVFGTSGQETTGTGSVSIGAGCVLSLEQPGCGKCMPDHVGQSAATTLHGRPLPLQEGTVAGGGEICATLPRLVQVEGMAQQKTAACRSKGEV